MKDIAPELLARLQADFAARMDKSSRIQTLLQRIRDGTATYIDAEDYSYELGNVLAGLLAGIDPAELPDGRMYYNIADRVLRPLLEQTHDLVAEQSVATLNTMNTAAGIGLKAQPALYDAERVDGIVDLAASRELYSEVSDKVAAAVTTYAQSVADDTLERTATFLGKAGLRPKIIRKATGKCCKWCRDLAGSYRYPETPEDVFRRHEYCHCTVYYDPGGAKRFQDVHEKQWRNEEERKAVQSRKELEALRTQKTPANRISEINQKNRDYMGQPHIYELPHGDSSFAIRAYKNDSFENIWCQTFSENSQKMCAYLDDVINRQGKYGKLRQIVVAKNRTLQGIAAYNHADNILYISEELIDSNSFKKIVDTSYFAAQTLDDVLVHELAGHKAHWEASLQYWQDSLSKFRTLDAAKQAFESPLRNYIGRQMISDPLYIKKLISVNAHEAFNFNRSLNELIADAIIKMRKGTLNDSNLESLIDEVVNNNAHAK